jgi:hypothetical protein
VDRRHPSKGRNLSQLCDNGGTRAFTTCIASSELYYRLDAPGASSGPSTYDAVTLTMKMGLFRTLRAKVGPTTQIGVSYVDIAGPQYVLLFTASCADC